MPIEFLHRGRPDETQRRCYDCRHLGGYVNAWCFSKEAIKARGTRIPGVRNCTYWAPARWRGDFSWIVWFLMHLNPFVMFVGKRTKR